MFIDNKYKKWYFSLIDKAIQRGKINGYREKHHIIPESLGGVNNKDNLVFLTAQEHFVAHMLLPKMTEGKNKMKMSCAIWRMCNPQGNKEVPNISSRQYAHARKQFGEQRSANFRHTEESRKRCARPGKLNGMYGRDRSNDNLARGRRCSSYIGDFITPWGRFETASDAAKNAPSKISGVSIIKWCKEKNDHRLEVLRQNIIFKREDIGRSYNEIGFSFIPKKEIWHE